MANENNDEQSITNREITEEKESSSAKKKLFGAFKQAANKAGQIAIKTAQTTTKLTQDTIGKVQRKLGEDYYAILKENPLLLDTLSKSVFLDKPELLTTVYNIPWTTTALWSAASGSMMILQRPLALTMGELFQVLSELRVGIWSGEKIWYPLVKIDQRIAEDELPIL